MTNPLISIIIPFFNAENYLGRCIQSVLSQSFCDYELILVDDGSADASSNICYHYAKRDSRIHVIHQPNSGVSAARNHGIEVAKGEYISFIDADDWIESNMYELLYDKAHAKDADYVYCDYYQEKDDSCIVQKTAVCIPNDYKSTIQNLIGTWFVSACMTIIRRVIISQNNIRFNTRLAYNEDFNFIAKCLVYAKRISKVNKPLYHYDESNVSSAIHQKCSRQAEDEYHSQIDIVDFYIKNHLYDVCKRPLNHRLVRCLYFYKNNHIDNRYDSNITFQDLMTCPHIGIKGKIYVFFTLICSRLNAWACVC